MSVFLGQDMNVMFKDLSSVCRGCLDSSREMKDMFECGLDEDFHKLTDIKINRTDEVSKLLCSECEDVITKCRSFYKRCKQSDFILNMVEKKQAQTPDTKDDKAPRNTITYSLNDKKLLIKVTAPDTEAKITYACTQSCAEVFKKKNDLLQHLLRRHDFGSDFTIDVEYFCSIRNCNYNVDSDTGKHFTGRKYLNQHISKVHKERTSCGNCLLNFPNSNEYDRHLKKCNLVYSCQVCDRDFKTNERLLVHLLRKHPDLHRKYKTERKSGKRKLPEFELDKAKVEPEKSDFADSPKRSFATQTADSKHIRNDVTLLSWPERNDEIKKDEISTQTVFDLLSLKSQTSEDESIFYSETVSLSDIQTQTLPLEFGLSRSNKETITSETQSPDLSIKETQTCFCLYDSLKSNFRCVDLMASGTQTLTLDSDLLSFSSAETQTCFDDSSKDF